MIVGLDPACDKTGEGAIARRHQHRALLRRSRLKHGKIGFGHFGAGQARIVEAALVLLQFDDRGDEILAILAPSGTDRRSYGARRLQNASFGPAGTIPVGLMIFRLS